MNLVRSEAFVQSRVVSMPEDSVSGSAKTCTIIRFPCPRRVISDHDATKITARLLAAAFRGRSENQICETAHQRLGFAENTIRAILRGETRRPDGRILLQAAVYCMSVGIDPMEVAGVKDMYQTFCGEGR